MKDGDDGCEKSNNTYNSYLNNLSLNKHRRESKKII
jgi:hypothetical protein